MADQQPAVGRPFDRNWSLNREWLFAVGLSFFLAMVSGLFRYFPGMSVIKELWLVFAGFICVLLYAYWKLIGGLRFSGFELFIVVIILAMPFWSAVAALQEFHQPLAYGVVTQRNAFLSLGVLGLITFFFQAWVSISDIERSLLVLAWTTLALYLFLNLILTPTDFIDFAGFASGTRSEGARFKFDNTFIIFGFFYYVFSAFRHKRVGDYWLATAFLTYLIVFVGGRSLLIAMITAFLICAMKWANFRRILELLPRLLLLGLAVVASLYVISPATVTNHVVHFSSAFSVLFSAQQTDDVSANARIVEVLLVIPYVFDNFFFGSGAISNQWRGGYESVLGGYFHPSDIGIIGVVYSYGLFGLIVFATQFAFAASYGRKLDGRFGSKLSDASKAFVWYYAIHSIVTGKFVHYIESGLIFIAVLWFLSTVEYYVVPAESFARKSHIRDD